MIDFHTHILPEMDDGSKSTEMSCEMIQTLQEQGADAIVLSPHYYFDDENISSFLKRRQQSIIKLITKKISNQKFPDLYVGSEVAFFPGISTTEDVKKLCIKGTDYMLLEMPFSEWSENTFREVEDIICNLQIMPIIVHPERFIELQKGTDNIERLLNSDVLVQMNCGAFEGKGFHNTGYELIKSGNIDLIGTDSHNMTSRAPNFDKGLNHLIKKFGYDQVEVIEDNEDRVLKDALVLKTRL